MTNTENKQVVAETKKVLTVVDRSTKAINASADALQKTINDLTTGVVTLTAQQTALANDIEFKASELASLDEQLSIKERENKAELALRVRENSQDVLTTLLRENGLTALTYEELEAKNVQVDEAIQKASLAEYEAVRAKERDLIAKYTSEISNIESNHKVELAELRAQASSDATTIKLLKGQIESLEATINANREAEIAKAQAQASAQGVVVNTGK